MGKKRDQEHELMALAAIGALTTVGEILPVEVTPDDIRRAIVRLDRKRAVAEKALRERSRALRRAWDLYENSGIQSPMTGRTGNAVLDDLGSHLDEWAMRSADDAAGAEPKAREIDDMARGVAMAGEDDGIG